MLYEKIATADMCRADWLKLRKTGIGGLEAGAVCGLNSYSSPMNVFRDKTCETIEDVDSESLRQGRELEDYVAQRFMEATGLKVRRCNYMFRSMEHKFMIHSLLNPSKTLNFMNFFSNFSINTLYPSSKLFQF